MKKIENFAGWILANRMVLGICAMLVLLGLQGFTSPKTVSISEREFYCGSTSPDGIGAKCDAYVRRVK